MKQILFIQGAGGGAYEADRLLVDSLPQELGATYEVRYPVIPDEGDAPFDLWKEHIRAELPAMPEPVMLAGPSVGASHLAKCLTEIETE